MKITNILAGAMLLSSSMFAVTLTEAGYGNGGASVTFGLSGKSEESFNVPTKLGSVKSNASLKENKYEWSLNWNVDPTISWTYTTILSGFQSVDFFIPIVGGPYDRIFNSGGYTLTGVKGTSGTEVKGFNVQALVPYPGTIVGAGLVTVPGTKLKDGGTITKSDDNTNNGGVGPFVAFGPNAAAFMGVRISFTSLLNAGDQLSMNGTMTIEQSSTPEPATFGLIGAALVALGAIARRRA